MHYQPDPQPLGGGPHIRVIRVDPWPYFRAPATINTAPTAHRTPPTTGESLCSDFVVTPTEASPTFTPWVSLCGMGTTNERIPAISRTAPTQNSGFIFISPVLPSV